MEDFRGLYDVRDGLAEDIPFILATFLRGLYYGDTWFSEVPKPIFMAHYEKIAKVLLSRSVVKVACLKEDPNVILGYSILSPDYQTIHFVYVKGHWRKRGIGRSLLPQFPVYVTHITGLGRTLLSKFKDCVFNPFNI